MYHRTIAVSVSIFMLFVLAPRTSWAQGSLAPPGPPAPMMRTLDEVEPRIPISQADVPFKILESGSYMLTENLKPTTRIVDVISIQASGVTLDLRGFSIEGDGLANSGISVSGPRDSIIIRNGIVRDVTGVAVKADEGRNVQCDRIHVLDSKGGISVGTGSRVHHCQVSDITVEAGIDLGDDSRVRDCLVTGGVLGIQMDDGCDIQGNTCRSNSGAAMSAIGNGNRIVGNLLLDGAGDGLRVTGADNYIADNVVKGNADNYDIVTGNKLNLLFCELPETIDWPAMVTVAGTLTGASGSAGIAINASDVTIDLDGHALVGGPGSLEGIDVPGNQRNIEIRNGTVREWGRDGVDALTADNSRLMGLRAFTNGWDSSSEHGLAIGVGSLVKDCVAEANNGAGIVIGEGGIVRDCAASLNERQGISTSSGGSVSGCTAYDNGLSGINAASGTTVSRCAAMDNGGTGISTITRCQVSDCVATRNGSSGITVQSGSSVIGCTTASNTGNGIFTFVGCAVENCTAYSNTGDGIEVSASCRVVGNTCRSNGSGGDGAGIRFTSSGNRIEDNHVTSNDWGIKGNTGSTSGTLIVRNTASGNNGTPSSGGADPHFDFNPTGNPHGLIEDISSLAGGVITSTHVNRNWYY